MILTNSRKNIVEPSALDGGIDLKGAQSAIDTEEVSGETRNMWGGHRSPREGLSRSVVESRDDVETRSPDVDTCAKVREGSLGVINRGGGNGDSFLDASWRAVDSILVLVSGGDDNSDPEVKELREEQRVRTGGWLGISRRGLLGQWRCRGRLRYHRQDSMKRRKGSQCV